jgi:hypothetical protein
MSFSFFMAYKPDYQKRRGKCGDCEHGIMPGEQVMIGSGFFHGITIKKRLHMQCFLTAQARHINDWFFKNEYAPKRMSPAQIHALNNLRARKYYIKKIGGEKDELAAKLAAVDEQIAFVKADKWTE